MQLDKTDTMINELEPDGFLEVYPTDGEEEDVLRYYFGEEGFLSWKINHADEPMPGAIQINYEDRTIRIPEHAFSVFVVHRNSKEYMEKLEELKGLRERVMQEQAASVPHREGCPLSPSISLVQPNGEDIDISIDGLQATLKQMKERTIAYPHFIVLSESN